MRTAYLDTSSLIKRYVKEPGSEALDALYRGAERGETIITFSVWNIGEAFGALDRKERLGQIPKGSAAPAMKNMISESLKMSRMNALRVAPLNLDALSESWRLTLKHHIYVADALQISTAAHAEADIFLSPDKRLNEIAEAEGLKTTNDEET